MKNIGKKEVDRVMAVAVDSSASKQAYLIIAHKADTVFRTLIEMLDHPKNDIFIHMDAKTKSYDPDETLKLAKHSRVIHATRIKVSWGGYSQIKAELILLETATSQGHYEHYHILSGQDLPIKRQDDIIAFFERHHGTEFVHFRTDSNMRAAEYRVRYYHPFQEKNGRGANRNIILRAAVKLTSKFQRIFHIHRNKGIKFRKGCNWISITDEFARYVLSKREWIHRVFHDSHCGDELFIQTLITDSPFYDRIYNDVPDDGSQNSCMRFIDWKRGGPYTFKMSDLEEIKSSPLMFARKFDEAVDIDIVRKIQQLYS